MPHVRIESEAGRVFTVPDNANLREALMREGVPLYRAVWRLFHCGGRARCGSCAVTVVGGADVLSPRTPHERARLGDGAGAVRLACQTNVRGDCAIDPTKKS